jgi:hypothetical protein
MKKTEIKALKGKLKKDEDPICVFDNALKGRCALVISAGPSAVRWREVYEKVKHKNPIVVCVKGTLNEVKELCDIHFLNSANLICYKAYDDVLSIMTDNGPHTPIFGKYDVKYKVMYELIGEEKYSLAKNNNYECFTLRSTGIYRPYGPGVMYESVFYTLVHLGIKDIVCVGWDIADERGANTNFNDKTSKVVDSDYLHRREIIQKIKHSLSRLGLLGVTYIFKDVFKKTYGAIKYYSGFKINHASMLPGEAELVSQSLNKFKAWLNSHGVKIKIISNSKWMSSLQE